MSIKQVQIKNILELISQAFYVNGINPLTSQINKYMSNYFFKNKPGQPLKFDAEALKDVGPVSVDRLNDFMATCVVNLDTVYEASIQHVDQIMMLNTILRTHLERLKVKRKILENKIDDFLLGIFNSDGYFYSFSDNLVNVSTIDFNLTSAYIDFVTGIVTLPSLSSHSKKIEYDKISQPTVRVLNSNEEELPYEEESPFSNAIDGMTNTAWSIKVITDKAGPITTLVKFQLGRQYSTTIINKIDLKLHTITPIQCAILAEYIDPEDYSIFPESYSDSINISNDKMTFISKNTYYDINSIELQFTKSEPDYILKDGGVQRSVFVFGIKELIMLEQSFDLTASFVSKPISIDENINEEKVIDAVSLVVDQSLPNGSNINYYIAENNDSAVNINDFNWQRINPLQGVSNEENIVRFDGTTSSSVMIRRSKRSSNDIEIIPLDFNNQSLTLRNPTPSYIAGVDVYKLCPFSESFLPDTISLEEGINTNKIYYTDYSPNAIANMDFWKQKLRSSPAPGMPTPYFVAYGEIDTGHEFFYGGDIGENFKSVYIETSLYTKESYSTFLKECRKSDPNSKTWDVKIFLNGEEIANMPAGTDYLTIPWSLQKGKNNIVTIVNIPDGTSAVPTPYIGTLNIMAGASLTDFGTVKLGDWSYVDTHKFTYNQVNDPTSFTIYNNEIITRRQPTNNFRLSYRNSTEAGPKAIRLRADLSRTESNSKTTPILDSYRIRFSYG